MAETAQHRPRKERKENADRRRRQLLDAACRSIVAHGLVKTTLATVATEAGLSQGVAAFYFKSKGGLLTEALRDLYQRYEDHWMAALEQAGDNPARQLRALIAADFHPDVCGPQVLPIWFAFWGELRSQPQYTDVAEGFDTRRRAVLLDVWHRLLAGQGPEKPAQFSEWMDTLMDGYWQRLHLAPGSLTPAQADVAAWAFLVRLVPDVLERASAGSG